MQAKLLSAIAASGLAAASYAGPLQHTSTATKAVTAAAATALTESPVSHVKGKAFDRVLQIYLEITAYNNSIADPNCKALIDQGILLSNMYGAGEMSQPNYVAPASGDIFGVNSDSFIIVDKNVSTMVDLLEDKGISWADYNEGLPYSGFEGYQYDNPVEGPYVRKHNLLVRFESITSDPHRLAKLKNLTLFYEDVEKHRFPQWAFLTPNLNHNGHDTNVTVACAWTRSFVEPLLANPYFNNNTLIYITWDANSQYLTDRNQVAGILLGSALPKKLVGTVDNNFYNHYSEMSSIEANWGLHTLGRWDVGANVWAFVARKTRDTIRKWNSNIAGGPLESYYWNQSYGGVFNSACNTSHVYVAPNLCLVHNGRTVLPSIANNHKYQLPDYYRDIIEVPDALHPPKIFEVPIGLGSPPPLETPIYQWPLDECSDTTVIPA